MAASSPGQRSAAPAREGGREGSDVLFTEGGRQPCQMSSDLLPAADFSRDRVSS